MPFYRLEQAHSTRWPDVGSNRHDVRENDRRYFGNGNLSHVFN